MPHNSQDSITVLFSHVCSIYKYDCNAAMLCAGCVAGDVGKMMSFAALAIYILYPPHNAKIERPRPTEIIQNFATPFNVV